MSLELQDRQLPMNASPRIGGRLYEIDFLRFLAAFMVVFHHYFSANTARNRVSLRYGDIFQYGDVVERLAAIGPLGVEIFFTISGFVIAASAEGRTCREFIGSRAARILPAFWFCCLLTWSALRLDSGYRQVGLLQLVANLFFVARPLGFDFVDGVYWSLVIEVRFYLMIAVLVYFGVFAKFQWFLLVWFVAAIADYFGLMIPAIRFLMLPQFAHNFIVGGAVYIIAKNYRSRLGWFLFGGATILAVARVHNRSAALPDELVSVAGLVVLATSVYLWLSATGRLSFLGRRWMVWVGALTYPLYLLHEDLGFLLMRHVSFLESPVAISLLAVALSLFMSWLVNVFIERPLAPRVRGFIDPSRNKPGSQF